MKVGLLLLSASEAKASARAAVFRKGLRERGGIEGGNLLLEYRTR